MEKLTIGKLANSAGISLETVRYYERIGLMPKPGRTDAGHRNYAAAHVRQLTFIRRARELGFAIEDIRALLELAEPDRVSCGEVQKIAARHLHNVRSKLADLAKMEKLLAKTVAQCSGNRSPACPVLEMLDTPQNGAKN
jgi:MerR family transcriptional regulator, mercuric resistance operon regulatory protein